MTNEEKNLLLQDLCARLPYGVKVYCEDFSRREFLTISSVSCYEFHFKEQGGQFSYISKIKPYLRPMESMTEKERSELRQWGCLCMTPDDFVEDIGVYGAIHSIPVIDWLNAHHFDYRGLIEKGLALPAPDGMYNN